MDRGDSAIGVDLGALDDTTARSVAAFLEARHKDRFTLVGRDDAAVVLIDLDQPAAEEALGCTRDDQVVVGIGFDPEARLAGCRRYAQKPLTGAVVTDVLADAAALIRDTPLGVVRPDPTERVARARDVFHPGRRAAAARRAPVRDWAAEPPQRLDRALFARAEALATSATLPGTTGSAGEILSRRHHVEEIVANDGGDVADPEVHRLIAYSPSMHLDGLIAGVEAEHAGHPWEIRGNWGTLVGDPARHQIIASAPDTTLRLWCHQPLDASVVSRRLRTVPDEPRHRRLDREIAGWNIAVWCSQGRLPDAVDPFAPVSMRAWPDLTRGVVTPSALPIIALLTSGSHRPVDIAGKIGASRSHVFVVLAAAHHLGLLLRIDDEVEGDRAASAPPPPPPPHRGVLRRLLGKLGSQ